MKQEEGFLSLRTSFVTVGGKCLMLSIKEIPLITYLLLFSLM